MEVIKVKIKRLKEDVELPTRGSEQAAGYDLRAYLVDTENIRFEVGKMHERITEDGGIRIFPKETVKVHTGLAMEIPKGYFGALFARSGFATKQGIRPANCVGVIDSDYRGEIIAALHNDGDMPVAIKRGDRIAQLVIQPYLSVAFEVTDNLDETERNEGGFGSTGKE